MELTRSQSQRLRELGYQGEAPTFEDQEERDEFFERKETELQKKNRNKFKKLQRINEPDWKKTEQKLRKNLYESDFTEVQTPHIISMSVLKNKMNISEESNIYNQIYKLDEGNKCLRPMLAPNLYRQMKHFLRISKKDVVKLFELGTCFRKEQGKNHVREFKMLNAVEVGEIKDKEKRTREMIDEIIGNLVDYKIEEEKSTVYGKTLDIEVNGLEIASSVIGPHPLDANFSINKPWIGIGIGVERLIQTKNEGNSIKSYARSLSYQDGIRLEIN
ncbi:MAG: Pyrrolysyl-tRNA-synthetase PylS [Candidatus Methanohalarchaeum thermophilum]|uniref:Pyrrolysyl-tRNA-synthetase PylS n=1 Tax=Methanohalarchaeum thermophilum TaxID=1903181 RepID=A0A1Q6DTA0_METT1|nr:MAG: Pyrrolysyl-tRNA-synthetase PylS [Candidatus Methanohalarchaeum thermophilum]